MSETICSAKGCSQEAKWALVWANPRIHTGGRTKTWLACETHRESLSDFLGVRHFLQRVVPFTEFVEFVEFTDGDRSGE